MDPQGRSLCCLLADCRTRHPDQRRLGPRDEHEQPGWRARSTVRATWRGSSKRTTSRWPRAIRTGPNTSVASRNCRPPKRARQSSCTCYRAFTSPLAASPSSTLAALLRCGAGPVGTGGAVTLFEVLAVGAGTVGVASLGTRLRAPRARDGHRGARDERACGERSRACPATITGMIFGPASPDLLPGARNAVETSPGNPAWRARHAHRRSRERRGRRRAWTGR